MSASFRTLFERSRYSSRGRWQALDDAARKQRMEQQERFAVSMIGLTLRHDSEFRLHFLESICRLTDLAASEGWEVSVEPVNWGDLVLKHRTSSSLLVVEFKIDSELREHQDPSKPQFTSSAKDGQCAGYGWEIAETAARENWTNLRYVTVEKRASWSKARKEHPKLVCIPRKWAQLLRLDMSAESALEAEVYDCLAQFGVSIFFGRRMKTMRLATCATEPLTLLAKVLANFEAEFRRKLIDANPQGIGLNIHSRDFPQIAVLVNRAEDPAGWFGYESDPPLGPRLSVWFYCYDSTGVKALNRDRVKSVLQNAGFGEKSFLEDGFSLCVFCKAEDSTDDEVWFTKVLDAVNR